MDFLHNAVRRAAERMSDGSLLALSAAARQRIRSALNQDSP
jgi:hypothetical protein